MFQQSPIYPQCVNCSPDVYLILTPTHSYNLELFLDFTFGYIKSYSSPGSDLLMKNLGILCGLPIWPHQVIPLTKSELLMENFVETIVVNTKVTVSLALLWIIQWTTGYIFLISHCEGIALAGVWSTVDVCDASGTAVRRDPILFLCPIGPEFSQC